MRVEQPKPGIEQSFGSFFYSNGAIEPLCVVFVPLPVSDCNVNEHTAGSLNKDTESALLS